MRLKIEDLMLDDDLDKETLKTILNRYNGMTIYVSKREAKRSELYNVWREQTRLNVPRSKIVKIFINKYDISKHWAYKLIRKFEDGNT